MVSPRPDRRRAWTVPRSNGSKSRASLVGGNAGAGVVDFKHRHFPPVAELEADAAAGR